MFYVGCLGFVLIGGMVNLSFLMKVVVLFKEVLIIYGNFEMFENILLI